MNRFKEKYKEMLPIIEEWCNNEDAQLYCEGNFLLTPSFDCPVEDYEIRYPKKTIIVNGIEVPAPEKGKLKIKEPYFVPNFSPADGYSWSFWHNDDMDNYHLSRGLVYKKKEDAIARAKAMLVYQEKTK